MIKRRILYGLIAFNLFALIVFFLTACAKRSPVEEFTEKIETKEKSISFAMPESCSGCHTLLYQQWKSSLHSIAFIDPLYWAEAELAGKEAGDKVRNFCHSCHAAAATLIEKIPADANKASSLAKAGVPCDLCHTVKEVKKIGNKNIKVETASNTKRGPYKDSYSPFHLTEYSQIHTRAEFCAACHNVYHPVNGLPIENPYDEWKNGPYAKEGIVCQDCHMTPGPGVTKPNPGQVAYGGPTREHYYTHSTVGGNAFITNLLGMKEAEQIAISRLKYAASIEVERAEVSGSKAVIKVKVTNKGAGHNLPTGLTVMRQMWIHLIVTDASGKIVYENGKLDKEGNIPNDARIYHTVYADKSGKPTEKVWEAEKIIFDRRIPPKGSLSEVYEFSLPANAKHPLTVKVELLYRSAPQHIVNKLLKSKTKVPVILMTSTSKTF